MMKRFTFLFTVLIFFATGLSAQYTLSWDGEVLGDTVTVQGDPSDTELVFEAILTNNSEDTVAFKLQRRLILLLDGTTTSYCWGTSCFPPNNMDSIDVARDTVLLAPNQATPEGKFSGHYLAEDFGELTVVGTSMIEYKFFNEEDEDDNVTVVVKFVTTPDGIVDQLMNNAFISDLYPNPATSFVTINYDLPQEVTNASVRIINILGSVVKNEVMNKNATSLRMDISDLTNGVYFYSIVINDKVYKTKKLIVK
jgi:hypothetical protein